MPLERARVETAEDELGRQIEELQTAARPGETPQLRLFVILLLAWIAVPAIGALMLGLALLRRPARAVATD